LRNLYRKKKWPVLEKATAEASCWPKMQPKRGSPAKEKHGNTDTWSDGKGNKGEKNSR
jgi:hypothetical protein